VETLDEALEGIDHLCATAMTPRDFGPPTRWPREHFAQILAPQAPSPVGGMASLQTGPQATNVATHRDETIFSAATRFDTPLMNIGGQAPTSALQGSVKYYNPLQEDILVSRNNPEIQTGFTKNPYTQSLSSTGT
jgi:hypothetical protein